jgi:hypothetical protein
MYSAVGRIWGVFARAVGNWDGTWCAYCGAYVGHKAWDAHNVLLDQPRVSAGNVQMALSSEPERVGAAGTIKRNPLPAR